jgi:hypothetical protein
MVLDAVDGGNSGDAASDEPFISLLLCFAVDFKQVLVQS